MGKDSKTQNDFVQGHGSLWHKFIYHSKTVPMLIQCRRVLSYVHSTVLNGSIIWPRSGHDGQSSSMGSEDIASHVRVRMKPHETWVSRNGE